MVNNAEDSENKKTYENNEMMRAVASDDENTGSC